MATYTACDADYCITSASLSPQTVNTKGTFKASVGLEECRQVLALNRDNIQPNFDYMPKTGSVGMITSGRYNITIEYDDVTDMEEAQYIFIDFEEFQDSNIDLLDLRIASTTSVGICDGVSYNLRTELGYMVTKSGTSYFSRNIGDVFATSTNNYYSVFTKQLDLSNRYNGIWCKYSIDILDSKMPDGYLQYGDELYLTVRVTSFSSALELSDGSLLQIK